MRMGVDGDSPSPELGLELVLFKVAGLKPGLGHVRKVEIGRILSRAKGRRGDDLLCIICEDEASERITLVSATPTKQPDFPGLSEAREWSTKYRTGSTQQNCRRAEMSGCSPVAILMVGVSSPRASYASWFRRYTT
jgi:hypothetical protein